MSKARSNKGRDTVVSKESNSLAILSKARQMIAGCESLDDLMEIRNKAESIRRFVKASGESMDVQNKAAAIRLQAERRAGELLAEMPKQHGARGIGKKAEVELHGVTSLSELGIDKAKSHRWQRLASLPEEQFEAWMTETAESGKELVTKELLRLAKHHAASQNNASSNSDGETDELPEGVVTDLADLQGQTFGTIYADPPWKYGNQGTRAATGNHYDTLTVEQLCEMPFGELAAEKAHLWLWTTNGFLFECPRLFEAWGFEFKSSYVWVKPQIGIGNYLRNSHELLLLAVRGGLTGAARDVKSWGEFDRTKHSAKPEWIRHNVVERVSPGPRLELFGRRRVQGWTVFGTQVEPHQHEFT